LINNFLTDLGDMEKTSVIYTNKAQCRDCYRCLRGCPVKAIEMKNGQASIVDDLCIECGTCIRECPQGAKSYRNDLELVKELIANNDVCVSVAPAFAALFDRDKQTRIAGALRKLGFSYIGETSVGAQQVAKYTEEMVAQKPDGTYIATACPTVVSYIEKYHHNMIGMLTPVISPMASHAKSMKKAHPGSKVVFIGPCLAKKSEAARPEIAPYVDAVLSFDELLTWMDEENLDIAECPAEPFDETGPHCASLFPLEGGLLKTADMSTDLLAHETHAISGVEEMEELVRDLEAGNHTGSAFIEPLFCHNGCINGPLFGCDKTIYQRRRDLMSYVETKSMDGDALSQTSEELATSYDAINLHNGEVITDEMIKEILEKTGKHTEEDELNCGACGYESCRDKAEAVIRGMAETEMCIPYMRRMAEQRTDKIIETNPNGVVILDKHFNILNMNPAFCNFFKCTKAVHGKNISYLIDPEPFEKLAAGDDDLIEESVTYSRYGLECRQIVYKLADEQQYVGIFVNITDAKADHAKLQEIQSSAVKQAQELLQHQISMAQQMAKFLGESTAQGEELVGKIMKLVQEDNDSPGNEVQPLVEVVKETGDLKRAVQPKLGITDLYRKR